MHGDTNRPCLVGYRSSDCLSYPPRCVSGKLEALCIIEFFNRFHQAEVALLNEVEKLHASANVAFCDRHDKTQVCFAQNMLCLFVALFHTFCKFDLLICGQKRNFADVFEVDFHRVVHARIDDFVKRDVVLLDGFFHFDVLVLQSVEHHLHILCGCVEVFQPCHYVVFADRAFALSVGDDFVNLLFQKLFSVHLYSSWVNQSLSLMSFDFNIFCKRDISAMLALFASGSDSSL